MSDFRAKNAPTSILAGALPDLTGGAYSSPPHPLASALCTDQATHCHKSHIFLSTRSIQWPRICRKCICGCAWSWFA